MRRRGRGFRIGPDPPARKIVRTIRVEPYVYTAGAAIEAVAATPRWGGVTFSAKQVQRPEEGLIVIAYQAEARRENEGYKAWCTTTMRRRGHEDWLVVQHSQLPPLTAGG